MADPSNPQGLSKNELKKLAKKAEKAAKKQGGGGDGGPPAQGGGGGGKPAPAKASPPIVATPVWKICHADKSSPATLKAVWASELYGVELKAASQKEVKKVASSFWGAGPTKTCLLYGDEVVGGGGNALAKAMAFSGEGSVAMPSRDMIVDEWCEWERSALRHTDEKKMNAALDDLEKALIASGGIHLVGRQDTLADVVILSTLDHIKESSTFPPTVAKYLQAHAAAIERAKTTAETLQSSGSAFLKVDLENPSLLTVINAVFTNAALKFLEGDEEALPKSLVAKCKNAKDGDYQCTAAMPIFGVLKGKGSLPASIKSPQHVAQAIIDIVGKDHPVVTELTLNGPGFVVCRIKASYLQKHLQTLLKVGKLPKPAVEPSTCLVDFSSPNIAKEMHVGHLRSTIIGESVCRILEFVGHKVHRVNHVGDWGTQFGMLIQYLKEEYPEVGQTGDLPNITDLTAFYKNAKQRFDESPEFKKTAQLNVVKLQSGDEECLKIWNMLCEVSRREFQKVYDRLDVTVHECGESFYNAKIPPVIKEFEAAKMIKIEEGGAKCVFVDGFKIPLMLQKSDGGFGYDSTDMAALKYRTQTLKAQRVICITDFSQENHFKMCFGAARAIGWISDQKLEHIGFGTVNGEDGKRFKTRSGETVRLVDLLDESVSRMEASLKQRIEENKANITIDEAHDVAEAIGYGAVKYFDLRRNPTSSYNFSYDQMLDTKGNTAVYLLYARVRLESIIAKAKAEHNTDIEELLKSEEPAVLSHPSERNLALNLQMFPDILNLALDDLFPYHICDYVYNVCTASSDFVTQCKVLGSPEMKSRLLLCHATSVAMDQCFDLLAIRHVKRI